MSACRRRLASRVPNSSVVPVDIPKCMPLARMSALVGAVGRTGPAGGAGCGLGLTGSGRVGRPVRAAAESFSCSHALPLRLPSIAARATGFATKARCADSWSW